MECWIKVTQYFNMHLSMDDYRNLKLIFASHEGDAPRQDANPGRNKDDWPA
jgi:hypothetical protein